MKNKSRKLSYYLRHSKENVIEEGGWVNIYRVSKYLKIEIDTIKKIIKEDNQRYTLNKEEDKIRANYGHSVRVDMKYEDIWNIEYKNKSLYHVTLKDNIESILEKGLRKQKRMYVHLSDNKDYRDYLLSDKKYVLLKVYKNKPPLFNPAKGIYLTNFIDNLSITLI